MNSFMTGKNKKIEVKQNPKILSLLESFDEDPILEIPQKIEEQQITHDLKNQNSCLYHPSKLGKQEFKIIQKCSDQFKKISSETIIIEDKKRNKLNLDEQLTTYKKRVNVNKRPIYEMNKVLLAKIKKIKNSRITQIMKENSKELLIIKSSFKRTAESKQFELDYKIINQYFEHNYKDINQELKQWIKQQGQMIGWKLNCKDKFSLQNIIYELEYRYYIQYILQYRTLIQQLISRDESLNQHLILLVTNIEINLNKTIIELSDGWYSIFFIGDKNPIFAKIKIGQKIHLMNLFPYPICFDTSNIQCINNYHYQLLMVTTQLNSIKKANPNSKLGKQQVPYFNRSIRSLRSGTIPYLDVFIMDLSYLISINNNQKQAIISKQEYEQEKEDLNNQTYSFYIQVCDSLNYFENSEITLKDIITIYVQKAPLNLYTSLYKGLRVKLIKTQQLDTTFQLIISKSSGIILNENIPQYKFVDQIKIQQRNQIIINVKQIIKRKYNDLIIGLNESKQIKIEIQNSFFETVWNSDHFLQKKVTFTQLIQQNEFYYFTSYITRAFIQ